MKNPIQLRLIDKTNGFDGYACVIMQKNEIVTHVPTYIAWMVIHNPEAGDIHPFEYSDHIVVSASDEWGNYTPKMDAAYGTMFKVERTESGDQLFQDGNALKPDEIDMLNALPMGSYNFHCYRSGKKIAVKEHVPPEQRANFKFLSNIYLGVVSIGEVEEGSVINPLLLPFIKTEFSLEGLLSADIIMTGGGVGLHAEPFQFTLDKVS